MRHLYWMARSLNPAWIGTDIKDIKGGNGRLKKMLAEKKPGGALLINLKNVILTQYRDQKITEPPMLIKYE